MYKTPFWNTQSNWHKTKAILANKDNYCYSCNKPQTTRRQVYCGACHSLLMTRGLEPERVKIGTVYKATINYQQYLCRSILGCNAPLHARGIKEDRIAYKVSNEVLTKSLARIHNLIIAQNNRHTELYTELEYPRLQQHILFRLTLYYIAYHQLNLNTFKSEAHFYASISSIYYTTIERFYIRKNGAMPVSNILYLRTHYTAKSRYALVETLDSILGNVLADLVS